MANLKVQSPNTTYTADHIESKYNYETTRVHFEQGDLVAIPEKKEYVFRVQRKVNKFSHKISLKSVQKLFLAKINEA